LAKRLEAASTLVGKQVMWDGRQAERLVKRLEAASTLAALLVIFR
jgi:uncharacterized iron-regulated protein